MADKKSTQSKNAPKQINLSGKFLGLDGTSIADQDGEDLIDINMYVGNMLVMMNSDDPGRTVGLGTKMYNSKRITLEKHDISYILNLIKDRKNANPPKIYFPDIMFNQLEEKMQTK